MGHHCAGRTAIRGMPRGTWGAVIALAFLAVGTGATAARAQSTPPAVPSAAVPSAAAPAATTAPTPAAAPVSASPPASVPASPPPAGTAPTDTGDPIRVRLPSLGEVVVMPNFAPSYEEQREFHQSEYDRLRQRYVPPPDPQPSRTDRLLGQPETLSTGSLPPANPLLDQRGAIPHEISVNNGGELTTGGPQPPPPPQQK